MKRFNLLSAIIALFVAVNLCSVPIKAQDIQIDDGATVNITTAGTFSNNYTSTTASSTSTALLQINPALDVILTGDLSSYYGSINIGNGATLTLSPSSQFVKSKFYVGASDATSAQTLEITSATGFNTGDDGTPSITMGKYGVLDLTGLTGNLDLTKGDLVLNNLGETNAPKIKFDNQYHLIVLSNDKTITGSIDVSKHFDFSDVTDASFTNNEFLFAETFANGTITGTPITTGLSEDYAYSVVITQSESYDWKLVRTPIVATVLASGGITSANYTSLKAAFDAINAGTHTGIIQVQIKDNCVETESCVLNASLSGSANYSSINIYPIASDKAISGWFTAPIIDLNGADNVTIDGRVHALVNQTWTASGSANLTILNANASNTVGTSTVRFINDASSNTIKYCSIKGATTSATDGIIFFSTGTTNGNDDNIIEYNNITYIIYRPVNTIYSNGTANKENSGNIVRNNNIYDFLNPNLNSYGINIIQNNTAWTISNNSFYETTSFAPTHGAYYYFVKIANTGVNYTVSGNYIGGSATNCGGTALTKTATYNNPFYGINVSVGESEFSNIQGNTIKNISWSNSEASNFMGIQVEDGKVKIGTIVGNEIGENTGTGSITYHDVSQGGVLAGIMINTATKAADVGNNKIGSIKASVSTLFCISSTSHSNNEITITNNIIGSETPKSIEVTPILLEPSQILFGVFNYSPATISGNTISNLTNNSTSAESGLYGIAIAAGINTISNNNISKLSCSAQCSSAVVGIYQASLTAGVQTVSGNTISELNANGASNVGANGIVFTSDANNTSVIEKNFIHSFSATVEGILSGINITGGKSLIENNIIALGNEDENNIEGITANKQNTNTTIVNNTVSIEGTVGTNNTSTFTYALVASKSANTYIIKNNIFSNTRSGGGDGTYHLCGWLPDLFTNTVIDYNNYYAASDNITINGASIITTIVDLRTYTNQDAHSSAINPSFTLAPSTTATDYKANTVLMGETLADVTHDFEGTERTVNTMGAIKGLSFYIVSTVQDPKNTWYVKDDVITFKVTVNENATITGTPTLPFKIGATDKSATYDASSTNTVLEFKYSVLSTDNGGITIPDGSLVLNGGTIKNIDLAVMFLKLNGIDAGGTVDNVAPEISSVVTSPNSTWYKTGDIINFAVTASEAVNVVTTNGTPALSFTIGTTDKNASYFSTTNNNTIMNFQYTVVSGDNGAISVPAGSISLNSGTIKDRATNNATLTLAGITVSGTVDTDEPTITSVTAPADSVYRLAQTFDIVVNTDTKTIIANSPTFNFKVGTTDRTASYICSNPAGTAHTFRYTVLAGDNGMIDFSSATIAINQSTAATLKDEARNDANLAISYSGDNTKKYAEAGVVTFFVKTDGDDSNTGLSWADAKLTPTRAINTSLSGDQVWVKAGTYKPTSTYDIANPTDRHKHFRMKNGVAIYGGFAGTESAVSERGISTNETILNGDIGTSDDNSDNCYHIIYNPSSTSLNNTSILDGFTITNGNANGSIPQNQGGGLYFESSNPKIINCTVKNNNAENGAGLAISMPFGLKIYNSIFFSNSASGNGGAIYTEQGDNVNIVNTTIANNLANNGAGIASMGTSINTNNCIIWNNEAVAAGNQIYDYFNTILFNYTCYSNGNGDILGNPTTLNHNITTEPKFKDAANGDFSIYGISPCIDAGENEYNDLITDIRGTGFGRKLEKLTGNAGTIDMGAYEYKFGTDAVAPSPELTTKDITLITLTSAQTGGDITTDNGKTITTKGIVWSLTTEPKLTTNELNKTSETVVTGSETASFNSDMTSLANNTKYYVRAYAINELGTGYGEEKEFTTLSVAPTSVNTDNVVTTGFGINWTAPANTGSETITYSVEVSTSNTFSTTAFIQSNIASTNTSVIATGLTANTKYFIRVKAVNAGGSSEWSNTMEQVTYPSVPTAGEATNIDSTSVTANWTAPTQGSETFTYHLQVATTNQFAQNDVVFSKDDIASTETHYDVTSIPTNTTLDPNTTYYYRIACKNTTGTGAFSTVKSFITLPSAPTAEVASDQSGTQFTANWSAPQRTGALTYTYTVQMSTDNTFENQQVLEETSNLASTVLSKIKSGFTAGTIYYYRVKIVSDTRSSVWSNTVQAATYPELAITDEVTVIKGKSAVSGGEITFNGGVEVTENGLVIGISENPEVEGDGVLKFTATTIPNTGSFSNISMTGLTPGTTYYVRSFAKNVVGYGYGVQVSFTTVGYPTEQTSNLRFSNVSRNSISLAWNRGDGDGIVIFAKSSRISTTPLVDGTTYSAGLPYGRGTMIDRGAYCVYNALTTAPTTSINITGLDRYMLYYFRAFEYNEPTDLLYNQTTNSTNPASRYTLRKEGLESGDYTEAPMEIYPNPAKDQVSLNISVPELLSVSAELIASDGRVVKTINFGMLNSGLQTLSADLSDIASGVYLISITIGEDKAVGIIEVVK